MTNTKSGWKPSAGDEVQNSHPRREAEGFYRKYIDNKEILDIGCGTHKIAEHARGWDIANGDGDAEELKGVSDETYETVFSSHLLEHLPNPMKALLRWWEVLKVGGHLIVAVPDEDLYEQGNWPSIYNPDHRTTWTLHKTKSWCPDSKNLLDLIRNLPGHKIISAKICDDRYDYAKGGDQGFAERQIEVVVQKVPEPEPWKSSVPIVGKCICGKIGTMKVLGMYMSGNILVQCDHCGQQLCWAVLKLWKKLGVVVDEG